MTAKELKPGMVIESTTTRRKFAVLRKDGRFRQALLKHISGSMTGVLARVKYNDLGRFVAND